MAPSITRHGARSRSGQRLAQGSSKPILSGPHFAHLLTQMTGLETFRNLNSYHSFETK